MKRSKGKRVVNLEVYREDGLVCVWAFTTLNYLEPETARELAAILIKAAKKAEKV